MVRDFVVLLAIGALTACSGSSTLEGDPFDASSESALGACPGPASDMCSLPGPSYMNDIVPILEQRCNNCHVAGVDGGPWPLGGYAEVRDWRSAILRDLRECTMPPADAGLPFPEQERAALMAWLICDAPDN
jgi:hypothetical protein